MNKAQGKLRQRVFAGALVVPSAAWILLSAVGIGKKLDYDTGEKRAKHEISEDARLGNITGELDAWVSDRVPFRSVLLSVNSGLDWFLELPYNKIIEPILLKRANTAYGTTEDISAQTATEPEHTDGNTSSSEDASVQTIVQDVPVDDSQSADIVTEEIPSGGYVQETPDAGYLPLKVLGTGKEKAIQGRNGWLFYANVLESYQGLDLPTDKELEEYFQSVLQLHAICEARGMEQIFIYYPNKESVYSEYMPNDCVKADKSRLQVIEEYAKENYPDLPFDYIYEEILDAKDKNLLFQKQDTHWTAPGALVGLNNMYRMLGFPEVDEDSMGYTEQEGKYGDLFYLANAAKEDYEPEVSPEFVYNPEMEATVIEDVNEAKTIQNYASANPNGKMLVIIGDSFTNAMTPILRCDFTRFYYVCWEDIENADWSIINQADYLVVEAVERNTDNIQMGIISLIQNLR